MIVMLRLVEVEREPTRKLASPQQVQDGVGVSTADDDAGIHHHRLVRTARSVDGGTESCRKRHKYILVLRILVLPGLG